MCRFSNRPTVGIGLNILLSFLSYRLAFASAPEQISGTDLQTLEASAVANAASPIPLFAHGPGTPFASIEAAAIDALTYAYIQARATDDLEFMRGGTIHRVAGGHYSYAEIHRAGRWELHRIRYVLRPQDVARFHLYPCNRKVAINRINERPSRVDLKSVSRADPLHRPLFILHPSLKIRAYRGEGRPPEEVADLRRAALSQLVAESR